MVEQKNKMYLVTGGDFFQRRKDIIKIKKKIFEEAGSKFNLVTLYAKDLDLDYFKNLVFTFSFRKKKIILLKGFSDLSKPATGFLFDNLAKVLSINYLIFESDTPCSLLRKNKKIAANSFFEIVFEKSIGYENKVSSSRVTMEDFCRKLYRDDLQACLFIADELLSSKSKEKTVAAQILGVLVSRFSSLGDAQRKKEAFVHLWQADRALKETSIDARLLVERLLVNLKVIA